VICLYAHIAKLRECITKVDVPDMATLPYAIDALLQPEDIAL
jgi:hypothetical protein